MTETKHDKFVRLRDIRLPNALKHMNLLTNLAAGNYDYSRAEAEDMIAQLSGGVNEVAVAFGLSKRLDLDLKGEEPQADAKDHRAYGRHEWDCVGKAMEALMDDDKARALDLLKEAMTS